MEMAIVGDFLDRVAGVESDFEQYCGQVRDTTTDNNIRLVTYFLARHRHHLRNAMRGLPPDRLEALRRVALEGAPVRVPTGLPADREEPGEVCGQELIETAVAYITELAEQYARLMELPLGEEGDTFFRALISIEHRDVKTLNRMLAIHYF